MLSSSRTFSSSSKFKHARRSIRTLAIFLAIANVYMFDTLRSRATDEVAVLQSSDAATTTRTQLAELTGVVVPSDGEEDPSSFKRRKQYKYEQFSAAAQPISCSRLAENRTLDLNRAMNFSSYERLTTTDPAFWISLHNKKIDRPRWTIMKTGFYYETGMTKLFAEVLRDREHSIVVDIGMNIGWFSLWSAALGHSVTAFEPNVLNHYRLCESKALNNWTDANIQVLPYGLGKIDSTMSLSWSQRNPGEATFLSGSQRNAVNTVTAQVKRLDDLAVELGWLTDTTSWQPTPGFSIALLKVDVEGFEPHVFAGAPHLFAAGIVQNIFMEFMLNRYSTEDGRLMLNTVANNGYSIKHIGNWRGGDYHKVMKQMLAVQHDTKQLVDNLMNWTAYAATGAQRDDALNIWWTKGRRRR